MHVDEGSQLLSCLRPFQLLWSREDRAAARLDLELPGLGGHTNSWNTRSLLAFFQVTSTVAGSESLKSDGSCMRPLFLTALSEYNSKAFNSKRLKIK